MIFEFGKIACIMVFFIDIAKVPKGFFDFVFRRIFKFTELQVQSRKLIKPFECSLCMTAWMSLIYYAIITPICDWVSPQSMNIILYSFMWAFCTEIILHTVHFIKDTICGLFSVIVSKIE